MTGRIFNGKQYKRLAGYRTKKGALHVAAENRRGSWNARVVKEGNEWAVYTRYKLRRYLMGNLCLNNIGGNGCNFCNSSTEGKRQYIG